MSRWLPTFALARASGILVVCTLFFFIEHFIGLGKLYWILPISTISSFILLFLQRNTLISQAYGRAELVFLVAFIYGFIWKWFFPFIYPTSERITDLYFITNYLPGQTLPPLDNWFPPNHFNFYYAFQHYAAALMGRIFNLGPGLTYNLAFVLLMALPITLAWDFTVNFLNQPWKRWLVVLTFVIGGTGATPFVHLFYKIPTEFTEQQKLDANADALWASQRFIGTFDQLLNTDIGIKLFSVEKKPIVEPRELPLESFGYQFFLGDYHPPLGGFFLLMLALAGLGFLEKDIQQVRHAIQCDANSQAIRFQFTVQAVVAFTVPLMIATNTWTFPLQGFLIGSWVIWRYVTKKPPLWIALLLGGGSGFLLLYPFLSGFTQNAIATPIKWVSESNHTPLIDFIAMHWPLLLFGTLNFFYFRKRVVTLPFAAIFLTLLLFSEYIYVDDPTGDRFERTNSVMKWWSWIWTGGLITLSTLLLASKTRWINVLVVMSLSLINWYGFDVANYLFYTNKSDSGKLYAHSIYTQDPGVKEIFEFLKNAPSGIVLENNYGDSFTDSCIYAAFAVKPCLLGWPMHLQTWHTSISQAWLLKDQIISFYNGELLNADSWLIGNNVKFIVWNSRDELQSDAWGKIKNAISKNYNWYEFNSDINHHIGLWIHR